jgi:DNA-binding transcriptional ArsR family regulator
MSKKVLDEKELEKAHKRLSALKNPQRIEIIKMLSEKPKMNVTQIYTKLNMGQASTSHELKVLRDAGVLDAKREGKEIYYSINQTTFENLLDCIKRLIQ